MNSGKITIYPNKKRRTIACRIYDLPKFNLELHELESLT